MSCIPGTAARVLSVILCSPVEEEETGAVVKKAESITRTSVSRPADQVDSSYDDDDDDDDDLFAPFPPRPECPICLLTLPLSGEELTCMSCCGNSICRACESEMSRVIEETNKERRAKDPHYPCLLQVTCPLCRTIFPENDEDELARLRDRMERNHADAFFMMALHYTDGQLGLQKDKRKAFELFLRAAELGHASAMHHVARAYYEGDPEVVEKDESMSWHYFVKAARGGCVLSRFSLGAIDINRGNIKRAYKHWQMSVAAGCDVSLRFIKREFEEGWVTKDAYDMAQRDYQNARDEMKSDQRDKFLAGMREEKNSRESTK